MTLPALKSIPPSSIFAKPLLALKKFYHFLTRPSIISYWQNRAKQYGFRSVFDLRHSEEEIAVIANMQRSILLPLFRKQLDGSEKFAVDFGCGPGRFTRDIADAIKGRAIGVDPVKELLALAPPAPNVIYELIRPGKIPVLDSSADVVWVCLVFGAIRKRKIRLRTIKEIDRILSDNGMIFFVETTSDKPDGPFWRFHTKEECLNIFPFVKMAHLDDYNDLDERISIFAGRRLH